MSLDSTCDCLFFFDYHLTAIDMLAGCFQSSIPNDVCEPAHPNDE